MLAGEPPFTGATAEILAARKLAASIPSIAQIRSSVVPSIDAVIARAMVPVAPDRYATAGEFATALTGAFATRGSSRSMPSGKAGVPTRSAFALSAAALAMISVAAWTFASHRARASDTRGLHGTRDSLANVLYRQAHDEIDRRTELSIGHGVILLRRALERDSNYVDAWADMTRALAFAQNNRYAVPGIPPGKLVEAAVSAGQRALEADSMSAAAWIASGTTLYLIEPTTRRGVIHALHRATALDSNSADAWYYLGTYFEDDLESDSGRIAFRRAIAIRPTHPLALAYLALHYMWLRQPDTAIMWADSAARSNPTNVLARQARGLVLIQLGRVADAEDDFNAMIDVGRGPERVWGWSGLTVIAWRRHDRRAVDSLSRRAVSDADTLHPSHHEAVYLAWMYAETGHRDRALAVLERFARPRNLHFQLHLAREFTLDSLRREPRFMALLRADTTERLR
jgi:tetratricopeptide (TPR) repeat protein